MKETMGTARHIVVVDGDRAVRATFVEYLRKNGFSASGSAELHTLARLDDRRRIDLAVIDLMLPHGDGLALCATVRRDLRIPVIATSANAEDVDRILALEIGADDFLAKPFNQREMLARIRNVLRRSDAALQAASVQAGERYCFAGWMLDTTSRSLHAPNGDVIALAGGEFELLLALVTNANRVLTRDELIELTKGRGGQPFDRSIDVKISRLRQRLRDHAQDSRMIRAIYGKGYVLAAQVVTKM